MKKIFLMTLLWSFLQQPFLTRAGIPDGHSLQLEAGYKSLLVADQNVTTLLYQGKLPAFSFAYHGRKHRSIWWVSLDAAIGGYRAKYHPGRSISFVEEDTHGETDTITVPMDGNMKMARLGLGYLQQLGKETLKVRPALGVSLNEDIWYPQGFVTPGQMSLTTLSLEFRLEYTPAEKHEISGGLSLPVVGVITRMPYHNTVSLPGESKMGGFFRQGTDFRMLNSFQQVEGSLGYHYRLRERLGIGTSYGMTWTHITKPLPLYALQHTLLLNLTFHL